MCSVYMQIAELKSSRPLLGLRLVTYVTGLEDKVLGLKCLVLGLEDKVLGLECLVLGLEDKVLGRPRR